MSTILTIVASPEKLQGRISRFLQQCHKQIGYERHPNLYFDNIGTLSVEITQEEILLDLFEQGVYLPPFAINQHDGLRRHVKIVGQQTYKPGLFALFDVRIRQDACNMVDFPFVKHDDPLTVFHLSPRLHIHAALQYFVSEILLHLCDIHHIAIGKPLKLLIIDASPVHGHDVTATVDRRGKHEGVVGGCRGEANVARHPLVGMDDGVNLDAAFLPLCPGVASHPFEQKVGEEGDRGGMMCPPKVGQKTFGGHIT